MTTPASASPYTAHYHAKQRARERHGLELTDRDLTDIIDRIARRARDVVLLKNDRDEVFVRRVAVRHAGRWLPLVYDESRRFVLTVLPREALWPYQGTLGRIKKGLLESERADAVADPTWEGEPPAPSVGTVTGFVVPDGIAPPPAYAPPDRPCRTIREAETRIAVLVRLRSDLSRDERTASHRLRDDLAAEIHERHRAAGREYHDLLNAVQGAKAAQLKGSGYAEPIDFDAPLPGRPNERDV